MKRVITIVLQDIRSYRLRLFLVVFGISWGTITVSLLMSLGVGMKKHLIKGTKGLGENIITVWGQKTSKPYKGLPHGRRIRFTVDEVSLLKKNVESINSISPEFSSSDISIKYKKEVMSSSVNIRGVNVEYADMRNLNPVSGRFLDKMDVGNYRRVVFIGNEIKERIFGREEAINKEIMVNNVPFIVIGIMQEKKQTASYGGKDGRSLFIPYTTYRVIFGANYLSTIVYRPESPEVSFQVQDKVRRILAARLKFAPDDKEAIGSWNLTETLGIISKVTTGVEIFLVIVGSLTLFIAGAAVANIMYFIVDERRREIGIRRAVGASSAKILWQFLFESCALSLLGGFIGLTFSMLIIGLFSFIPETGVFEYIGKPVLAPSVPVVTVVILSVISILAGFFPARKAATLNPVECLRYE